MTPQATERAFLLDCGRKYFSPQWIKDLILELERAKMNALYVHFSEDMGMRLESKQYPWLAGGDHSLCVYGSALGLAEDDGKYLTQAEMAEIVTFARGHGVEVIPSLDSPGHMNYLVKKYNAHYGVDIGNYFHKNGQKSIVQGSSILKETAQTGYSRGIDIANEEAVRFARSLYTEYGRFFRNLGCTKFDLGGDELLGFGETIDDTCSKWNNLDHWQAYAIRKTGKKNAVAYDAFLLYINEIYALLRDLGYTSVRMWNDDAYRSYDTGWKRAVELCRGIEIEFWQPTANSGQNTVLTYLNEGHNVYNFTSFYTYYVLFGNSEKPCCRVAPADIEQNWSVLVFDPQRSENNPTSLCPAIKGGAFCLWCDAPAAEAEKGLLEHLRPYIRACGKKLYHL